MCGVLLDQSAVSVFVVVFQCVVCFLTKIAVSVFVVHLMYFCENLIKVLLLLVCFCFSVWYAS